MLKTCLSPFQIHVYQIPGMLQCLLCNMISMQTHERPRTFGYPKSKIDELRK